MESQKILKEIVQKDMDYGCYDARINGLSIYSFLRYLIRKEIIAQYESPILESKTRIKKGSAIISAFLSLVHVMRLIVSLKRYPTVFFSFPRVDKIGDSYLDKFTDPLIEVVEDSKDEYIILDHGRGGEHFTPRLHSNKIVYLDIISIISRFYSALFWKKYYNLHSETFDLLLYSLKNAFGLSLSPKWVVKLFYSSLMYSKGVGRIYNCVRAKRIIGPARAYMACPFYAAHLHGLDTFELQHGISFGETQMYSGYRDPMVMPDFFLAFGDNKPLDVYGIDETRIVNIGWALNNYVGRLSTGENYRERDVLVISDPEITDKIIAAVVQLADNNPDSTFYLRPHPHEIINNSQMSIIASKKNVRIQDKSINISVVLQGFNHVIGEDSTVLYEALAVNKKVGKLFICGLESHYLDEADQGCFWEIYNQNDFDAFINGDVSDKKSKCIYSPFNKELFCKTLKLAE